MNGANDVQSGPCVVCGATNYSLSFGGPTICPACDCGASPPQAIVSLITRNTMLRHALDKSTAREKRLEEMLDELIAQADQQNGFYGGNMQNSLYRTIQKARALLAEQEKQP